MKFYRIISRFFILASLLWLASCFTRFEKETPLEDYPAVVEDMVGTCPDISGVYKGWGHFTCSEDAEKCVRPRSTLKGREYGKGHWGGSVSLLKNLIDVHYYGPTELIQPDDNTLIVVYDDTRYTLRRNKGEFDCSLEGIIFSYGPTSEFPLLGLVTLSWLVEWHSRTFVRREDKSLTMTIKQSANFHHVWFGGIGEWYYFVHWQPVEATDKINDVPINNLRDKASIYEDSCIYIDGNLLVNSKVHRRKCEEMYRELWREGIDVPVP